MAQKMSNKKKAAVVAAGVLAVTLAIGGAMAWTDYSQTARNTFKDNVDADVLLHDDFDGKNKDVYVENTGNTDVYVRVKFAEYFQIGNDSILDAYGTTAGQKADPKDVTTWPIHQFKDAAVNNVCDLEDTHKYFTWNMSGAQKQYLAGVTEADGNGYAGLSKTEFDSYNVGDPVTLGDGITTYKRETVEASTIIMLSKWLDLVQEAYDDMSEDDKKLWDAAEKGCWLLDTDGWAYWSAALEPDTATNLLLDEVTINKKKPYDNWAYHIDVQMQAATINEMDRWYLDGIADVANPDNSIATTTEDGELFIKYKMDEDTEYVYEEIGTSNVWKEFAVSSVGQQTPTGNYQLAGNDEVLGTDDDNMLAGRSAANNGGIAIDVASIDADKMQYNIAGVSNDYYVTAGIDQMLGTYDDVIKATDTKLGMYPITSATEENVGWNYLGGELDNMLVATEYVLDSVKFNDTQDMNGYKYANSNVFTKMQELWTSFGMDTNIVNDVTNLDMDHTDFIGNEVWICVTGHTTHSDASCTSFNFGKYSSTLSAQSNIDLTQHGTKFFALSLEEIYDAYGEPSDGQTITAPYNDVQRYRTARYTSVYSSNNAQNTSWTDGVARTHYWLRSPGYIGSRAAIVIYNGGLTATGLVGVTYTTVGVRPACYLNLSTATTTP